MSLIGFVADVSGKVALEAVKRIPGAEAGALPLQTRIFGDGASAILVEAEAAIQNEDPAVALFALGVGMAIATVVPISAPAIVASLAVTPMTAAIIAGAIEMTIVTGGAWFSQPIIKELFGAFKDYGWALDNPDAVWNEGKGLLPTWLGGGTDAYMKGPSGLSPLVLDLDDDGVEVTQLGYGSTGSHVYFDMNNDSFAERTAWVTGGDGMLAIDRNGNGKIDNQSELFGNTATHANDNFYQIKSKVA